MNTPGGTKPTWSQLGEIPGVCFDRRNLIQCIGAALLVGTLLFLINQADVVFGGRATTATWVKIGLSYVVPFVVSNYGIVVGSRRTGPG